MTFALQKHTAILKPSTSSKFHKFRSLSRLTSNLIVENKCD